jgi:hypothetical protein
VVTLDNRGSRIYLRGDTYPVKDRIKSMGGHWDPDERAWWVGKAKLSDAQAFCGSGQGSTTTTVQSDTVTDETVIRGKATYKGRAGYLVLWTGTTSRGEAVKLAFRDGSKVFWADRAEVQIDKTYQDHDWRGRREPGMTFGRLNRLAAQYKQARANGIEPCDKCGGIHQDTDRTCYMCGCTRCEGASGGLCEDD